MRMTSPVPSGFPLVRHLSNRLTPLLARTPFTPNQITGADLVLGIGAGWCYSQGSPPWMLTGAVLLILSYVLDNCDGEVARLKGLESRFGDRLDTFTDWLVHAVFFLALGIGVGKSDPQGPWMWLAWAAVAGSSINYLLALAREDGPASHLVGAQHARDRLWTDQALYVFRVLFRADFCFLVLALTLFDVAWWLLPAAAVGSQAYWMAAILERVRSCRAVGRTA